MQWNLPNILAGAASVQLFPRPVDPHSLLADITARATAETVTFDAMLRRYMAERRIGQLLMTTLSLSALGVAFLGARAGWSDAVLVPVALIPACLPVAVVWARRRLA